MHQRPLTSIVILTRNELEYTERCVESIRRHTPEPYELVFVDNGSTDGTLEYLHSLDGVFVVANGDNLGFGAGCNQGIARSRGERIMLLNNDTVVTDGWLAALHDALDASPQVGIAGPRSNHVAGVQKVEEVDYDVWSLDGLATFATDWCARHAGQRERQPRLIGFCMLIERAVIDRIGGFDLRFGLGNFEDDDICVRAGVAGFACEVCHDSFVHHFGSRTFVGSGLDHTAHMERAWAHFAHKWDARAIVYEGRIVGYDAWAVVHGAAFDDAAHYAPLVGRLDEQRSVTMHTRARRVLLAPDRHEGPAAAGLLFERALPPLATAADVTAVIRIDPRDTASLGELERIADALGDALPDIVLVAHSDEDDRALAAACDLVLCHSRVAPGLASVARAAGTHSCALDELGDWAAAAHEHAA